MKSSTAILFTFAVLALPAALPAQDELPAGKGKETTEKMCSGCHGLEQVTSIRLSRSGWASTVDQMVGRGAIGTDDEIAEVTAYLAGHFPKPVNVNKAGIQELQSGLGLSQSEAEAIVKARSAKPFKDLAALRAVAGVDPAKLQLAQAAIQF